MKQPKKPKKLLREEIYVQWTDATATEPAFLISNGKLIGEWYEDGELLLYIGQVKTADQARQVLEMFAHFINTLWGLEKFASLQKQVLDVSRQAVDVSPEKKSTQLPTNLEDEPQP